MQGKHFIDAISKALKALRIITLNKSPHYDSKKIL
jgi:hypothetical protein